MGVVALVGIVAGIGRAAGSAPAPSPASLAAQLVNSARAKLSAATQDQDPMEQYADAVHGSALLTTARLLLPSDKDLGAAAHIGVPQLCAQLQAVQSDARRKFRSGSSGFQADGRLPGLHG